MQLWGLTVVHRIEHSLDFGRPLRPCDTGIASCPPSQRSAHNDPLCVKYNPAYKPHDPSFHFIFHVLFGLILHCNQSVTKSCPQPSSLQSKLHTNPLGAIPWFIRRCLLPHMRHAAHMACYFPILKVRRKGLYCSSLGVCIDLSCGRYGGFPASNSRSHSCGFLG